MNDQTKHETNGKSIPKKDHTKEAYAVVTLSLVFVGVITTTLAVTDIYYQSKLSYKETTKEVITGTKIGTISKFNAKDPEKIGKSYLSENRDESVVIVKSVSTADNLEQEEKNRYVVVAKNSKMQKALNTVTSNFKDSDWEKDLYKYKSNFLNAYVDNGGALTANKAKEVKEMKTVALPNSKTVANGETVAKVENAVVKPNPETEVETNTEISAGTYNGTVNKSINEITKNKIASLSSIPVQGESVFKEQLPSQIRILAVDKSSLYGESPEIFADTLMVSASKDKNANSMNKYDTVIVIVNDGEKSNLVVRSTLDSVEKELPNIVNSINSDNASSKLLISKDNWIKFHNEALNPANGKKDTSKPTDWNEEINISSNKSDLNNFKNKMYGLFVSFLCILMIVIIFSSINTKKNKRKPSEIKKVAKDLLDGSNNELAETFNNLENVYKLHDKLPKGSSLNNEILVLASNMNDMIKTLNLKSVTDSQRRAIEIDYTDRIEKLISLLGELYYVSAVNNPSHWKDSNKVIADVKKTIEQFNKDIINSITELNSSTEIDFKVAMNVLLNKSDNEFNKLYFEAFGADENAINSGRKVESFRKTLKK